MEKSRLTVCVGPYVGQYGVSEVFEGRANSVSQVNDVSDMGPTCPLCGSVVGRAQKMENGLCLPYSLEENCPPRSCLDANTSVPSCIPLVPFKLLPECWSSEGENLNKLMCGFFKKNYLELQKFLPPTQCPLGFATRRYGNLSSYHWHLGQGPCLGLGLLTPEISLLSFYPTHVDVGPAFSISLPLLPVWMNVVSLILQLSGFHSTQFLTVLSDVCSIIQL